MIELVPTSQEMISLGQAIQDAIAIFNMVIGSWMYIIGLGVGAGLLAMIFKQVRRALP